MGKKTKVNVDEKSTFMEVMLALGVLFVYIYSIRIGFGQGFLKGLFMMFVPIISQIWLCLERGFCEPVGFSNLYSWSTILVFWLTICVGKAKKRGFVDKIGIVLWSLVLCAMVVWHDQGATKPEDVVRAFIQATLRVDEGLASYYASDDLRESIRNIDKSSVDYKILEEMSEGEWKKMRNRKLITKIIRKQENNMVLETWYHVDEDVWEPYSRDTVEYTSCGWKVSSGMNADFWKRVPQKR